MPRKERVEPARLTRVHGEEFTRYLRSVPALFPSFHPYPEARERSWSRAQMLRNREQWMVMGLLAVSLFLLGRMLSTG